MNTIDTQTWVILTGVAVLVLIALAAWFIYKKKQSHRLQERFGPEYGRSVDDLGSRRKAESELKGREKRGQGLPILPLPPSPARRVRDERGEADTEELRKAVVHYRALFDELLEVKEAK